MNIKVDHQQIVRWYIIDIRSNITGAVALQYDAGVLSENGQLVFTLELKVRLQ